ncbi:MAG: Rnase Y domain-containing protein, partial [Bacteroidales bacterium]|nr:Rnase Y domain-containing protein [Bacteroidales bacterium]
MNTTIIYIIFAALVGALVGILVYAFIHKKNLGGRKEEILRQAEEEAENIKKEKIFQAKEKFLQLKSEHEQH